MKLRVAINGFGRIGRMICRLVAPEPDLELVAVNSRHDPEILAHVLRRDTVHGKYHLPVAAADQALIIDGKRVELVNDRDPANLPWRDLNIDLVFEATGKFRGRDSAGLHLAAGARKVIITAPTQSGHDADATLVYGVNHHTYKPDQHHVISAASCTTTCLAPVVKVLNAAFDLRSGLMTTIHSFTTDQNLLDNPHRDLRRARAAIGSIIPTSTGAARAVAAVLPELKGKLNGFALRVPTPNVSVIDLTAHFSAPVTAETVNAALKAAAAGPMAGIIEVSEEPLVSADYVGSSASAIVDAECTMVSVEGLVKILAWYDNERGYSSRVVDLAAYMAQNHAVQAAYAKS